jgi:hypothetical protein
MAGMPKERQTLFFSATLSPEIKRLIGEFLREPVFISIKTRDTSKNVEQDVVKVAGRNKVDLLREMLVREEFKKVLIFGRTKFGVEKLCKTLENPASRPNPSMATRNIRGASRRWKLSNPIAFKFWWPPMSPRADWISPM